MIPEGWKEASLGELFEFKNGLNGEKSLYGTGTKFANVMDVFRGPCLMQEDITGSMQVTDRQLQHYGLLRGDVLFNRTSETDDEIAMASVFLDDQPAVFGGFVIRARPLGNRLMPEFCAHAFQIDEMRRELIKRGQGAVRANIGQKDLAKVLIKVPPSCEQRQIAKILQTWDRAIESVEALIANARAQKQALMQQLLPQGTTPPKKRLPGFAGEWRKLRIGDVAKDISERAGEGTSFPVLSCSKYDGMVESLTYFKKKVYSDDTSNYKVMRHGTFGFPSNHIEEGSIGYQDLFDAGIVSPIYCVFATDEQVEDGFLYKLLKTDRYRQIFAAATNASVDRRGSLRWKEFSRIPLPLPPLEEQRAINEAVSAVADVERGYETQLTALRQEKAALMQQLLTGKRRVKLPENEVV